MQLLVVGFLRHEPPVATSHPLPRGEGRRSPYSVQGNGIIIRDDDILYVLLLFPVPVPVRSCIKI